MTIALSTHFILSPYFLDKQDTDLLRLHTMDWTTIAPDISGDTTQQRVSAVLEPLSEAVCGARQKGHLPVVIAGDCCASIGVLAGLQRAGG